MASLEAFLAVLCSLLLLRSSFVTAGLPTKREVWTALRDEITSGQRLLQGQHAAANQDTFAERLFQSNINLANQSFESCFVQGIANGNLDPIDFGTFTMQHANYLFQMQNHLTTLSMQAIQCYQYDVAAFAFEQGMKYGVDVNRLFKEWDIKYAFCIESEGAMVDYLKFQQTILTYFPTYYTPLCGLPRHMLWDWLGEKLKPYNTSDNIYAFWICEECDSSHSWEIFVNDHENEYDADIAKQLFEIAMIHEFNYFSTSCGGEALPVPDLPTPPKGCGAAPMPPSETPAEPTEPATEEASGPPPPA